MSNSSFDIEKKINYRIQELDKMKWQTKELRQMDYGLE
jgi:hypothetical protein